MTPAAALARELYLSQRPRRWTEDQALADVTILRGYPRPPSLRPCQYARRWGWSVGRVRRFLDRLQRAREAA
jgi:hypothetical protein